MAHDKRDRRSSLTQSGRARRCFLEGTALAALGTTAAMIAGGQASSARKQGASAACQTVPTPMKDVKGKVAFITGGNSGIGLGIARAFTDAGMKVAITYRTKSHLDEAMKYLEGARDRVHAIGVDVTDRVAMENAAAEVEKVFGKVHVAVANAGVVVIGPLSTATYDDWDWCMGVNASGVFNTIRSFLPRIQSHGEGGHIIATSSLAGLLAHGSIGVYTASKFAVVGMMEALRNELADSNIGVSVLCPGLVNTNIVDNSNRSRPGDLGGNGVRPDPEATARTAESTSATRDPPPGMDPLEVGQLVLRGIRNNDLYILTTPEFERELMERCEAIAASLPPDVKSPPARITMGRRVIGRTVYASERDRKRCEGKRSKRA